MKLTPDQLAEISAQAAAAPPREEAGTPSQPMSYAALLAERVERIETRDG